MRPVENRHCRSFGPTISSWWSQFLVVLNSRCEESLPEVRERLRGMLANDSIEWRADGVPCWSL